MNSVIKYYNYVSYGGKSIDKKFSAFAIHTQFLKQKNRVVPGFNSFFIDTDEI